MSRKKRQYFDDCQLFDAFKVHDKVFKSIKVLILLMVRIKYRQLFDILRGL